ncbi:receptor-like protein 52 [Triticum aestivum]|uniref:receptor-like protein 52 n=1 Tax=Triticum aestivum TaxID=4565 RepID=UPI001D02B229|nr:receptor-like protein 52 [Triticum aestivum]
MANNYCVSFLLFFTALISLLPKSYPESTNQYSDEHQILLGLKRYWGSSTVLGRWNSISSDHCRWGGLTCTKGEVTAISLPQQTLMKPIPPSLCLLKNLAYLDLSYNNFSTSFPTILYNCSNLKYLDLSNNAFGGKLAADINSLSAKLEHLNLSSNRIMGEIPPSIGWFPKLKSLILDTNQFDGSYPVQDISNLANLEMLTLADNPFLPAPFPVEFGMNMTGEIPESVSSLTELSLLAVTNNMLQSTIPTWVWQHKKLQYLYMFNNGLTGEISSSVTAVNLVELDVSSNNLTGSIPDDFGKLINLTLLFLYTNQLHGSIPPSIGLLPNLRDIQLFENMLTGSLPLELGRHSPLVNLEVCDNNLSGELPADLCFNRKLNDIVVFNNNFSGKLPESLDGCYLLNNLMLYNNHFTGEFTKSIWSVVKNQLTTDMIQNNNFSGTFPTQLQWNFSRIEMSNNRFSGPIPTLAGKMKVFRVVNNLLSGKIPWDLTGISQVEELDLSGNQINGSIPMAIGVLKLKALNLSGNQISVGGFLLLKRKKNSQDHLSWKLTQFHALHFTEYNVLSGLCEMNWIGSGRSGNVYRICVVDGEGGSRMVAVKKIWNAQNLDNKLEKDFLAEVQILGEIRHTTSCSAASQAQRQRFLSTSTWKTVA